MLFPLLRRIRCSVGYSVGSRHSFLPACFLARSTAATRASQRQHVGSHCLHRTTSCCSLLPAGLQGHLDAALRSSSAAGEDPELLRRVDVRLPPSKPLEGDLGWDVFSLQYHLDGPLGAVLSPDAMAGRSRLNTAGP